MTNPFKNICENCGNEFESQIEDEPFCCDTCEEEYNNEWVELYEDDLEDDD